MPQDKKNDIVNNYLQSLIPSDAGISSFNPVQNALMQPSTQRSINLGGAFAGDVTPFFKFKSTNALDQLDEFVPKLNEMLHNEGFWGPQKEAAKGIIRTDPSWAKKLNITNPNLISYGEKYKDLNSAATDILNKQFSKIVQEIRDAALKAKSVKDEIMGKILPFIKPE